MNNYPSDTVSLTETEIEENKITSISNSPEIITQTKNINNLLRIVIIKEEQQTTDMENGDDW